MHTPYPTTFPLDDSLLIWDKLTGKDVPWTDLAHAEWELQGFLFGQLLGGGPPWTGEPVAPYEITQVELANTLKECCDAVESQSELVQGLPWGKLLELLLKLLPLLLLDEKK